MYVCKYICVYICIYNVCVPIDINMLYVFRKKFGNLCMKLLMFNRTSF